MSKKKTQSEAMAADLASEAADWEDWAASRQVKEDAAELAEGQAVRISAEIAKAREQMEPTDEEATVTVVISTAFELVPGNPGWRRQTKMSVNRSIRRKYELYKTDYDLNQPDLALVPKEEGASA